MKRLTSLAVCGVTAALVAGAMIWTSGWDTSRGYMGLLVFALPVLCVGLALPFARTLRRGTVDVYIGRMRRLGDFDSTQPAQAARVNADRFVEIVVCGNGNFIWRIEGQEQGTMNSRTHPIRVAVVPDVDEAGGRALTAEEDAELRHREREIAATWKLPFSLGYGASSVLPAALVVRTLMRFGILPQGSYHLCAGSAFAAAAVVYVIWRFARRLRFAKELRANRRAGVVRDGRLASGLPWVIGGEPAQWRLGRVADSGGVSAAAAHALEASAEGT